MKQSLADYWMKTVASVHYCLLSGVRNVVSSTYIRDPCCNQGSVLSVLLQSNSISGSHSEARSLPAPSKWQEGRHSHKINVYLTDRGLLPADLPTNYFPRKTIGQKVAKSTCIVLVASLFFWVCVCGRRGLGCVCREREDGKVI